MNVREAIEKRRSVRKFKDEQVPKDAINELIAAARLAPSGCNVQPTKISVVASADAKKRLEKAGAFAQGFVSKAPLILVICGDPAGYEDEDRLLKGENRNRCFRDLSIASAFIVLRATELGLSTCYIGLIDSDAIKKTLKIPDSYIIPYVICVGYSAEKPRGLSRKPLGEFILGEA